MSDRNMSGTNIKIEEKKSKKNVVQLAILLWQFRHTVCKACLAYMQFTLEINSPSPPPTIFLSICTSYHETLRPTFPFYQHVDNMVCVYSQTHTYIHFFKFQNIRLRVIEIAPVRRVHYLIVKKTAAKY